MPKGIDALESELSDASLPFGARLCAYTQKKHKLTPFYLEYGLKRIVYACLAVTHYHAYSIYSFSISNLSLKCQFGIIA